MTMNEALAAQKTHPKKILIDFYVDSCSSCKVMDENTYSHPVIAEYINAYYYPVKFNTEGNEPVTIYGRDFTNPAYINGSKRNAPHQYAQFMNVSAMKSLVFLDESARPITTLNGLLTPSELEPYLSMISDNSYLKIKTREEWDNYQSKFRSKIKN